MNHERIVTDWLNTEAPPHAPAHLLGTTLDRVAAVRQDRVLWRRRGADERGGRSSRPLLMLAASTVALSLLGAIAFGGALERDSRRATLPSGVPVPASPHGTDPSPAARSGYEAVLVRWERQTERPTSVDLVVVAVDREGVERPLTRLLDAGVSHRSGLFYPRAAVSSTGLLVHPVAFPHGSSGGFYHWQIVDLADLGAAPIVVDGVEPDTDQLNSVPYLVRDDTPGAFWGPGDRLALPWRVRGGSDADYRLAFVDGRTGDSRTAMVPEGKAILPHWAADGSGVIIAAAAAAANFQVLRPDGSIVDTTAADASNPCATKVTDMPPEPLLGGVGVECLAPDASFLLTDRVRDSGPVESDPMPRRWVRITPSDTGVSFEVEGSFAGWLEVTP